MNSETWQAIKELLSQEEQQLLEEILMDTLPEEDPDDDAGAETGGENYNSCEAEVIASLEQENQALRRTLHHARHQAAQNLRLGRERRVRSFLTGVGGTAALIAALHIGIPLGWRLFLWLAGTAGLSPLLLAALALAGLGGALLVWKAEDIARWQVDREDAEPGA